MDHRLTMPEENRRLVEASERKKEVEANDAYWLRRWAGDALNGLLANSALAGVKVESFINDSKTIADGMLKAFKDREKS